MSVKNVLWIGPERSADPYREVFSRNGVVIADFENVDLALRAIERLTVAVAIIWADAGEATGAIRQLNEARPEIEILAGTGFGVPLHVGMVMEAGATGMVDLRGGDPEAVALRLKEAAERFERREKERALLRRIRGLNDEFLKAIVALERRNLDLELKISADRAQSEFGDGPYRILVIDDELAIRQLFEIILEDYNVTAVETGHLGLKVFEERPFPLVITDKNLPGLDGHQVLERINELSPETDVIMITGYASKDSAIAAINAGAIAYLEKPFNDVDSVVMRVKGVIEAQNQRLLKRRYLSAIKDRNRDFLDQYRTIRNELERWLRGKPLTGETQRSEQTEQKDAAGSRPAN